MIERINGRVVDETLDGFTIEETSRGFDRVRYSDDFAPGKRAVVAMGIGDSLSISELCILPYAVLAALLRRRGGSATMTDRIESAEALAERLEFSAEKLNSDTAERARFIEADRAAVRADERAKALLMGEPWPLPDIVRKLANATQHLLGDHSGYESVVVALDAAREWLRALPGFPTEEEAAPQKPTRCTATNFYPGCVKEGE